VSEQSERTAAKSSVVMVWMFRSLVDKANSEGVSLFGPSDLLSQITRTVLEVARSALRCGKGSICAEESVLARRWLGHTDAGVEAAEA